MIRYIFILLHLFLTSTNNTFAVSETDLNEPDSGFTLSSFTRRSGGGMDSWMLELDLDGTLTWKGTHRIPSKFGCSKDAGVFVTEIEEKKHSQIVQMALDARQEQEFFKKDFQKDDHQHHEESLSLDTEFGDEYETIIIFDKTKSKTKDFLQKVDLLVNEIFDFPRQTIEMQASFKGNEIIVNFIGRGGGPSTLYLPKSASDVFYLKDGNEKIAVNYVSSPEKTTYKLSHKEKITLKLRSMNKKLKKGMRIHYNNKMIIHHASPKSKPLKLTLCMSL